MSPSFIFGCLLAIYYFVGRWTFARLDGDYASVPVVEQPRFWLVAGLVAVGTILQCSKSRESRQFRLLPVDVSILAFLSYMLLTGIWAANSQLAADKAFDVALIWTVALVIAVGRSRWLDSQIHLGLWSSIVLVGVALGTLAILHGDDLRAYAPGGGPNTFGRNMGLMAFGALYLASRYGLLAQVGAIVLVALAALLVVRCGSRGGLLAFSIAATICAATAKTSVLNKALAIALVGIATTAGLFYTEAGRQAVDVFQGRILEQTVQKGHLAGRDDLWYQAAELWQERPTFGWGLNGFLANSWNYPHNIFLEVTVEGGVIGLLLLLNVVRAWWRQLQRLHIRVSRPHLAALALTFAAAQTSGDLFDSRGIFLMLALSLPLPRTSSQSPLRGRPWLAKPQARSTSKLMARPLAAIERHSPSL